MSALSISELTSPKRLRPAPSAHLAARWSPSIGGHSISTSRNQDQDADAFNVSKKIDETMINVCQMMENVNVYSKNVGLTAKDITPPRFVSKDQYDHSPFGKQLILSDYSNFTSPVKSKSPIARKNDNPRIASISFMENISDSFDDEDIQ